MSLHRPCTILSPLTIFLFLRHVIFTHDLYSVVRRSSHHKNTYHHQGKDDLSLPSPISHWATKKKNKRSKQIIPPRKHQPPQINHRINVPLSYYIPTKPQRQNTRTHDMRFVNSSFPIFPTRDQHTNTGQKYHIQNVIYRGVDGIVNNQPTTRVERQIYTLPTVPNLSNCR